PSGVYSLSLHDALPICFPTACVAAIAGFYADNGSNDFWWHAEFGFCGFKGSFVFVPKLHSLFNALFLHKNIAVAAPCHGAFRRARNCIENFLLTFGLAKHVAHVVWVDALLAQFFNQCFAICAINVRSRSGNGSDSQGGCCKQ